MPEARLLQRQFVNPWTIRRGRIQHSCRAVDAAFFGSWRDRYVKTLSFARGNAPLHRRNRFSPFFRTDAVDVFPIRRTVTMRRCEETIERNDSTIAHIQEVRTRFADPLHVTKGTHAVPFNVPRFPRSFRRQTILRILFDGLDDFSTG